MRCGHASGRIDHETRRRAWRSSGSPGGRNVGVIVEAAKLADLDIVFRRRLGLVRLGQASIALRQQAYKSGDQQRVSPHSGTYVVHDLQSVSSTKCHSKARYRTLTVSSLSVPQNPAQRADQQRDQNPGGGGNDREHQEKFGLSHAGLESAEIAGKKSADSTRSNLAYPVKTDTYYI